MDAGYLWKLLLSKSTTTGAGNCSLNSRLMPLPEEVGYIESLVPRIETGLLELRDPGTGEVVFISWPSLTGESLLKTATRSAVTLRH